MFCMLQRKQSQVRTFVTRVYPGDLEAQLAVIELLFRWLLSVCVVTQRGYRARLASLRPKVMANSITNSSELLRNTHDVTDDKTKYRLDTRAAENSE